MTDAKQPDKFDWATELSDAQGHVTLSAQEAKEIGARLRSMRVKLKTYEDFGDAGSDVQLLRMGYAAARLEIESLRKEHADELAVAYMCGASREKELAAQQTGAAYAALPCQWREKVAELADQLEKCGEAWIRTNGGTTYNVGRNDGAKFAASELRKVLADETEHAALRASHGKAPAQADEYPALVCDYCGALTPDPWHSSGMLHGKMSKHIHSCDACCRGAAQAAPAYKDSTPELHIGDSAFESWYSTYSPAHKSDKQRTRDAYAAGMGDPLVTAAPAAVAGEVLPDEQVAFERHYRHLDLSRERDAWGNLRYTHDAVSLAWESWQARASRGQAPAVKREFTNELGNSIRITVEGPNSMHENIVTPMEAKQLREALNEHAQKSAPAGATLVHLDHIACIDGGELRYITGRKAPAYDCELYAMPNGGSAPQLYAAPTPQPAPQQDVSAAGGDSFLLLPTRPTPDAPANTTGLSWDAYSGAQMLAYGRSCSDAALVVAAQAAPAAVAVPDEIDRLRAALVYVAFALHGTRQYMLAEGVTLIDGDTVRVSRDGWTVEASSNPLRQPEPQPSPAAQGDALDAACQRACMELPEGMSMAIQLERHAGWIELHDSGGEQIELPNADGSLAEQMHEAVNAASAAQEGK